MGDGLVTKGLSIAGGGGLEAGCSCAGTALIFLVLNC